MSAWILSPMAFSMIPLDGVYSFFEDLSLDTAMISRFRNMFAKIISNVVMINFSHRSGSRFIYKFYAQNIALYSQVCFHLVWSSYLYLIGCRSNFWVFNGLLFYLTLSWRRPLSYRNQSIDLLSKSMDWFLYDNGLLHERVKFVID